MVTFHDDNNNTKNNEKVSSLILVSSKENKRNTISNMLSCSTLVSPTQVSTLIKLIK